MTAEVAQRREQLRSADLDAIEIQYVHDVVLAERRLRARFAGRLAVPHPPAVAYRRAARLRARGIPRNYPAIIADPDHAS